jgi:hypothetical protein
MTIDERSRRKTSHARVDALVRLRKEVRAYDAGVFGGFIKSPTLRAILIPSSGIGVLALLEHVLRP